ncbi:hypothetical protein P691DRAFT_726359 [Macrolepiota fuliginosa MF-IS2]|uniref:Nephrocystin 3-like N-terminal domain-containing protein n=1 Tax=Macrolepiota fuliginosa MF-IS2 TaxID=1400762 RepID=A0A9P6C6E6_9AGAR|nr:hypothetical protein P691DRAFT_726359 [Macrolepiota fuliginosa MF-IS2]
MVDRTQNVYVQGDRSEEGEYGSQLRDSSNDPTQTALPWLLEYIMRGAKFDSSDRDPPPRCHPGTRTTIIDKIHHWLEDPHPEKKLLWLRGLAGVGKSAIVQTLAEKLSEQGRLGASLFFSRPNGRTDPRQVFPTLAYQFAVQNPSYKAEFVSQYPSTPLIWMIASRPETHLKALFCEDDVKPILWEEDVPIDSPEACRDVEKFLHHEFTKIRKHYPDHIQETLWPANDQFLRITTAASGLFIFAQVIIHFIDDSVVGNPITQLRCVISIISRVPLSQLQRHPLAVLDAIYGEILSRIPRDLLKVAKDLITSLILFDRKSAKTSDINLSCICNFLIIERDDAITSLRHLHSVLSFPKTKDIGRARPRFYHKSFRDFLEDPSRSNEYSIDLKECGSALFWGSQALIETTRDPRSIALSWPNRRGNEDSKWLLTVAVQRMRDVDKGIRHGPSSSGFLIPFYSIEVPVPETRLQSIFESFNNRQLLKEELSITGKLLHDATYESPYKPVLDLLRQGETVKYATLPSLGIDKARLMNSTCTQRALRNRFWSCVLIELDEPASVQGDFEFVDLLLQFYDVAPPIEVAVWESKDSGRCAVITPRDHGISYTSPFSTIFVIVGF